MKLKVLELSDYMLVAPHATNRLFARVARLPQAREWVFRAPPHWRMAMVDEHDWPLAIGGLFPLWAGRAEAWLLFHPLAQPRDVVRAVNACARHMDAVQAYDAACRRIEMYVDAATHRHDRFAARMGMTMEGVARAWGTDGADHVVYARVAPALAPARAA